MPAAPLPPAVGSMVYYRTRNGSVGSGRFLGLFSHGKQTFAHIAARTGGAERIVCVHPARVTPRYPHGKIHRIDTPED